MEVIIESPNLNDLNQINKLAKPNLISNLNI